ncbi:putative short chain dehydrogenase/ reductase [Cryphonectria parasitica EP155]|uniref:Short chain dehydrogenase/ reductase n=1 Tax=Cryphonectria parasitica (strain ATCC 38755 / EP155) TaxID=660469 RepID=A0A9P4Y6U3_CRYP1|nr:putative short chain dehydrogenase/ reductase [Cryphonectria parasitica EP155]KAF3767175.1 putative short chain dehydrogenase/ reductase [Cryphonectria parasitica EP155]
MSFDVKGKFAIVTGAGSGINLAFAEQLLLAGCSVIFADIALRDEAKALIAKFPHPAKEGGPSALYHVYDQSNWTSISQTWEFALKTFPRIDILCPGAGIWEPPSSAFWHPPGISPLAKDDPNGSSYHILAVNLMGPIRFAQIALDYWMSNKIAGNLLLVASMSAYLPTIGTPLYNTSKGGLASFTLSLAQMKARLGIRVACMCPATTFTPAVVADYCKGKVREQDMNMTATECAEIMLRLVTEEQYGNGEVVEGMQFAESGSGKSDVRTRTVPGKNILAEEEKLWEQLKTKGMRLA